MKRNMPRHAVIQPLDESIKLIPLTKGRNAVVDALLYDWLIEWNWCAQFIKKRNCFYAVRRDGSHLLFMHEQIVNTDKDVDHEDRNGLDNRGKNLRPASRSENIANRAKQKNNTSGYKGVHFNKRRKQWQYSIQVEGRVYCEVFGNAEAGREAAAKAYDRAAIRYFGEFAQTNFPRSDYEAESSIYSPVNHL